MTIAVDFDGTVVSHRYPNVGATVKGSVEVLTDLVAAGHELILFTMRSAEILDDAVNWFTQNKIPLFGVNRNPTQDSWTSSPKAYASLYIDDAALGCPLTRNEFNEPVVDWDEIREYFIERKWL